MSEPEAPSLTILRAELAAESAAGFPHLRRIPHTGVIKLLDYFASLSAQERTDLIDELASLAQAGLEYTSPSSSPPVRGPALTQLNKVIGPCPTTLNRPFDGGYRYCDIKWLTWVARDEGGYEKWLDRLRIFGLPDLALQPRPDLLPDLSCIKLPKRSLLRKLVKDALEKRGFTRTTGDAGWTRYLSPSGDDVDVDLGHSWGGQLSYSVRLTRGPSEIRRWTYEMLWWQVLGWDYLTEENAARSIAFLPDLIEHLIALLERLRPFVKPFSYE